MGAFICPHCDDVTEFLSSDVRDPQCDCGAVMEPVDAPDERDCFNAQIAAGLEPPMPAHSGVSPREAR